MKTWKKVTLWMIGVVAVVFGGGMLIVAAVFGDAFDDMCATTVIDQFASPSGKLKAVLFQIDCGATTGFNSQVSIVPGNVDITQKDSIPKSFFAANDNHGQAPAGKGGGPEVRLAWKTDDLLEIQHHDLAGIIRAESKSKGVFIEYRTYR